jgi:hypothetical protein
MAHGAANRKGAVKWLIFAPNAGASSQLRNKIAESLL